MAAAEVRASFKDLERRGWTAKASQYSAWAGTVTVGAIESLLDAAHVETGARLLDVACGPGYGTHRAAARGALAMGIDIAPAMIAEAREKFPRLEFREGDGENLAFADASFDAIICAFGLLHMPAPDRAIAEAYRVLKPGGRYAVTVWANPDRHEFLGLVLRAIQAHGRMDVPLPPAPPMFRFSDPEECRRTLAATGFVDVAVEEVPLVWRTQTAQAIVDRIYNSTVRTAMLLEYQTHSARERIHRAIVDGAAQFARGDGYTLNLPAILSAARKP
jgi:ubiquinone/menaquinone biosynthesis C-methylase UbiE